MMEARTVGAPSRRAIICNSSHNKVHRREGAVPTNMLDLS
jgi:hypothetical protein